MSEAQESHATHSEHDDHHGPSFKMYMVVFGILAVCTAMSFGINAIFGLGSTTGLILIMLVSIVKATFVVAIFMHLKWDWSHLYFIIVPVFILGVLMVIVLLPDIVLAWST